MANEEQVNEWKTDLEAFLLTGKRFYLVKVYESIKAELFYEEPVPKTTRK